MKLKSLLLCGGMLAVTSTQAALTVTQRTLVLPTPAVTAMPNDGATVVYLYNPSVQGYLRGANSYNTRASVSTTGGYKWKITVEDAENNLVSLTDSVEVGNDGKPCTWGWRKMFADNASSVWVDNNNGANCNAWVLTKVGDGETYKISNPSAAAGWLSVDKGGTTLSLIVDGADSDWYAVTPEEYAANVANRPAIVEAYEASVPLWTRLVEADAIGLNVAEWEAVYGNADATPAELTAAVATLEQAILDFNSSHASVDEPRDMSALIVNATFDKVGDFTGWKGDSFGAGGSTSTCAERYNMNYDTWQQIDDMPVGVYQLSVQGFYRPNGTEGSWTAYKNGTDKNAMLYAANIKDDPAANDTLTSPITNIFYGIEPNNNSVSTAGLATYVDGDDTYYLPNNMVAAVDYFNAGYYKDNRVLFPVTQGSAKIGVLKTVKAGTDWSIFDNFALTYYGNGADAYQLWNATLVKDLPEYDTEALFVTAAVVEAYNQVKATAVGGTTYEEVMANVKAINDAKAAVENNIAAWAAYQEQITLAQKIMGDDSYNGEDLDALVDYVELDAGDILSAKALSTEEIVAATEHLKTLRENAVQNSILPGADVTNLLKNTDFAQGKEGWTFEALAGGNVAANAKFKCAEAWNNPGFDIYQTVENAAVGAYKVSVQGFYRRGRGDNAWKLYFDQNSGEKLPNVPEVPAYAYLNNSKTPLTNVFEYKVSADDNIYTSGKTYTDQFGYIFPDDMESAGLAFDRGAYTINAVGLVAQKGDAMRIGMKGSSNQEGDSWAIFTRFKLTYMGFDAEIIQPELEKTLAAVDLSKPMGTDVAAQAKQLIEAGNAALATGDGKEMFNALSAILVYNDTIDASVALFASLQTDLDDIENTIADSEAADDVKSKVATTVAEITDAMFNFTNADAEAAVATLADCRYKLALPAGYENATDAEPVNLTNLIQTPDFEKDGANSIEGWQNTSGYNFGNNDAQKAALCVEFYEKDFDMYQDITVPNGTYQVTVLAFNRQGNASTDYEEYANGTPSLAQLYVKTGDTELFKPIEHLASDNNAASEAIGTGAETTYTNNDGVEFSVPNDMVATRAYFDQGRYINGINVKVTDGKLRIGIRQSGYKTGAWVIMDEFRLWYLGTESTATEGGWNEVEEVEAAGETKKVDIYSVDGVKQNSLKKGVNIIVNTDAAGNANARRFFVK